jgi:predicted nuclease of predicted toxin-antitoxin system
MKILVDENVPLMTVQALRGAGHDVRDIRDTALQGSIDDDLWRITQSDERLLITTDKGFAQHREENHRGLPIVRLRQPNRNKIHQRVLQTMTRFSDRAWIGLTVVVRDASQSVWQANKSQK